MKNKKENLCARKRFKDTSKDKCFEKSVQDKNNVEFSQELDVKKDRNRDCGDDTC